MASVFDMLGEVLSPEEWDEIKASVNDVNSLSRAQLLSKLDDIERQDYLATLEPAKLDEFKHSWEFWARPEQLPPAGDWFVWMINAGRGFGKTRAGAEWVNAKAEASGIHVALIGETAAEVRDVMIEGPSGILSCAKPWNPVEYQPSKRRVVWASGAWATTFSGDSPNQLRGPNIDFAWMDELCLQGLTKIKTARGEVAIKDVKPGDLALTRQGYKAVKHAWKSSDSAPVFKLKTKLGHELIGTGNHPILTNKGWVKLEELIEGDILFSSVSKSTEEMGTCQTLSHGMVKSGSLTSVVEDTGLTERDNLCTEQSGLSTSVESQTDTKSTTGTTTRSITESRTLSASAGRCTEADMLKMRQGVLQLTHMSNDQSVGCLSGLSVNPTLVSAPIAINAMRDEAITESSVATTANLLIDEQDEKTMKSGVVSSVNRDFRQINTEKLKHVPRLAHLNCLIQDAVLSVQKLNERIPVYDIEVEDAHEFIANDILVHNCKFRYVADTWDALEFTMRAGIRPQVVVTTTPRPIPKYKELLVDPQTVVTGGSTYQNLANLAPSFLRRMIDRYHHTRLGLQELMAKVLDDADGSLWKRTDLDAQRIGYAQMPTLKRIVIGVDPAGSINTETGIIVSGVGVNDHVYTLDDCTIAGTPGEWGAAVVNAYVKWDANLVAVETNHGGDMCVSTIKSAADMAGAEVVCRKMTASKGKYARAEPIAARHEQGRLHHVGSFPDLEDELCQWEPGGTDASPNRLDAKVWAETVLFEGIAQEPIIFAPADDMTQTSRWRG